MVYLTRNDFQKQLTLLLNDLSVSELQELIFNLGETFYAKNRSVFLEEVKNQTKMKMKTKKKNTEPQQPSSDVSYNEYLEEFSDFIQELEEYSETIYEQEPEYDAYHYAPHYYDESAEEELTFNEDLLDSIEDYYEDAVTAFNTNNKTKTRDIFGKLLPALLLFDNISMDIHFHTHEFPIPVIEAYAFYLNAVYHTSASNERAEKLYLGFQLFHRFVGDQLNLQTVRDCDLAPLPGFEDFLQHWYTYLSSHQVLWANPLFQEATFLLKGVNGIVENAYSYGKNNPDLYIKTLKVLAQNNNSTQMLEVIQHALQDLPQKTRERSIIGKMMFELGKSVHDTQITLMGAEEHFVSLPTLESFLLYYSQSIQAGSKEHAQKISQQALTQNIALLTTTKKTNALSLLKPQDYVGVYALLLMGKYDTAIEISNGYGNLGWEWGFNPKRIVIPFLMKVLTISGTKTPYIDRLWAWSKNHETDLQRAENEQIYEQLVKQVVQETHLTVNQKQTYYHWCTNHSKSRITEIVENKKRKSYEKAAVLLKAIKDLVTNMESAAQGKNLEEMFLKKYSRMTAFTKTVKRL